MEQQAQAKPTIREQLRLLDAKLGMCLEGLARQEREREKAVQQAATEIETRVMERVGAALAEVSARAIETDKKVNGPVAKMMESMALDQIELKAKLDRAVAPLLQSMAMDQVDLKAQLESLGPLVHTMAMGHIDLKGNIKSDSHAGDNKSAKGLLSALQNDVEALQAGLSQVRAAAESTNCELESLKTTVQRPAETTSAFKLDNCCSELSLSPLKSPTKAARNVVVAGSGAADLRTAFAYSSKSSWSLGPSESPARLTRSGLRPGIVGGASFGQRSLPTLPPVQSP